MATSSIHIQRAVSGSVGHNSREHFSHSVVFTDEKNECTTDIEQAYKTYRSELQIRSEAYTERTGQKLQSKAVTQLSAVINLEAHHTLKDLEPIKAELERVFDTKVYQMAIHRDEGKLVHKEDGTELYSGKDFFLDDKNKGLYFDKKFTQPVPMNDYEVVKNYHAHIEMMGLDSQGNAIRQKMNKVVLQGLQTTVAKTLQMERGKPREGYTKEEMKQILKVVGKKSDYENTTLYAKKFTETAKELGIFKESDKRKDTHHFKSDGAEREKGKREALATQKELKAEMARLKDQLQQYEAGRAEYAALERLNKELKEQIKARELTSDQLKEQGQSISEKYASLPIKERLEMRAEMREILGENEELKSVRAELKALKEAKAEIPHEPINTSKIVQLQDEIKLLQITNKGLENELKETKSATVLPTKGENEASKAIEKNLEQMPSASTITPRSTENDLRQFEYKADEIEKKYRYPEEYAEQIVKKHTNMIGKVDKDALIKELGVEFSQTAQTLNRGQILVQDFKSAFERTKHEVNSVIKSTKMAFKDVFHKITGKSTEQVNEQRREQERAVREQQQKEREAQRAKEPEQVKAPSRGLSLGR